MIVSECEVYILPQLSAMFASGTIVFRASLQDVNECNNAQACPINSSCTNSIGSYNCTCLPGFTYTETSNTCVGKYFQYMYMISTVNMAQLLQPLLAKGVVYKPFVAYVDRRSQAYGGRSGRSRAFGSRRGSSLTGLWWHTWIVEYKPLVACVDRRS